MRLCDGGELYALLNAQPKKRLKETHTRFYASEVLIALQYLHLMGFVYRCARACVHCAVLRGGRGRRRARVPRLAVCVVVGGAGCACAS
eukprot:204806-Chlamydomonas_euryale.AAC.1